MKKNKRFMITSFVLPIVLFVAGIFITKALTEKKKSITLEIQINKKLLSLEERIKDQIESLEIEELFDDLNFMSIRLVNNGKLGINGETDIVKDLEIIFPDDYEILSTPTIIENPNEVEIIFKDSSDDNKIRFRFDLLNPKQSVTMDFFYTGKSPSKPTFKHKIVDLDESRIINVSPSKEELNNLVFRYYSLSLLLIISFVYIFLVFNYYPPRRISDEPKSFQNLYKFGIGFAFASITYIIPWIYFRLIKLLDIQKTFDTIYPFFMILAFSISAAALVFVKIRKNKMNSALKNNDENLERVREVEENNDE